MLTAFPFESVVANDVDNVPPVVVNVTGTPPKVLPLMSATDAVMADAPPREETVVGFALTTTRPTAAAPMAILIGALPLEAPPDVALIVAVPDCAPALNVTVARPLTSVETDSG